MFATFIGKTVYRIEKLLKMGGSTLPGGIVLKLFPKYLYKIKFPETIIMVTGSCGKGSTTKLISNILRENNMTVCTNSNGANLIEGITTTIILNVKGKKIKEDALVLEVDERYLKIVTKYIKPKYIVINNITRDQPPRQGNFDIVFNEILKGIPKDSHLIVNGDDPILRKFSLYHNDITYFGIDKNKYSYKSHDDVRDYNYCPKCNSKLEFDYYNYGSVGSYKCTKCDFKRDNIKYSITKIDYDNNEIEINKDYKINISSYMLSNLYNLVGSYSVGDLLKIDSKRIISALSKNQIETKLYDEFTVKKRKYTVLNCKAENNSTYNLSLLFTDMDKKQKTIVIGHREISRRYNHFDVSWMYDIYFEILNKDDYVVCVGPNAYDFAIRMKLAGIKKDHIIVLDDLTDIKKVVEEKTKGNVYGVLNFDYVEPFKTNIKEEKAE
jgi:UDP-N-acetylmuramyl tripeptide synthase